MFDQAALRIAKLWDLDHFIRGKEKLSMDEWESATCTIISNIAFYIIRINFLKKNYINLNKLD